jgi:ABC-2 type transport system ATP-binding protein
MMNTGFVRRSAPDELVQMAYVLAPNPEVCSGEMIEVTNLEKHYSVAEKEAGFAGSLRSFFSRKTKTVKAVDGVSFKLEPGEVVGFLGPNGAGKTTTLKMLSGLLHPTGGTARVLGYTPFERRSSFLKSITLVMGQKQQLIWDLPAMDSFLVNQAIYEIEEPDFKATMREFTAMLELDEILKKQVRKLSLGERMKCELAAALLHKPKVLFLDEPTIGLDVNMQVRIREFVSEYNQRNNATVILTSHYMADVTALCKRIIVIDKGHIVFDGDLSSLVERMSANKIVKLQLEHVVSKDMLGQYSEVKNIDGLNVELLVPRTDVSRVTARLLAELPVLDVTIEDPPIEEVIGQVFANSSNPEPEKVIA